MKGLVKKKGAPKPKAVSADDGEESRKSSAKDIEEVDQPPKPSTDVAKPAGITAKPEEPKKRSLPLLGDYSDSEDSDDEPDSKKAKT